MAGSRGQLSGILEGVPKDGVPMLEAPAPSLGRAMLGACRGHASCAVADC